MCWVVRSLRCVILWYANVYIFQWGSCASSDAYNALHTYSQRHQWTQAFEASFSECSYVETSQRPVQSIHQSTIPASLLLRLGISAPIKRGSLIFFLEFFDTVYGIPAFTGLFGGVSSHVSDSVLCAHLQRINAPLFNRNSCLTTFWHIIKKAGILISKSSFTRMCTQSCVVKDRVHDTWGYILYTSSYSCAVQNTCISY